jgi:membrane protease YdiL (CAAX protease family)
MFSDSTKPNSASPQQSGDGTPEASTTASPVAPGKAYGAVFTILMAIGIMLVPSVVVAIVLQAWLVVQGKTEAQIVAYFDTTTGQFIYMLITTLLTIGLVCVLALVTRETRRSLALALPKPAAVAVLIRTTLIYFVALFIVGYFLTYFTPVNVDQKQQIGFDGAGVNRQLYLVFISLVVLPPIMEELVFRGFLYARFRKFYNIIPAAILTSLLFGFVHLQLDTGNAPLWTAAIDTFMLSLALIYLREKTGSIIPSMVLHAFKNFIAFYVLFLKGSGL